MGTPGGRWQGQAAGVGHAAGHSQSFRHCCGLGPVPSASTACHSVLTKLRAGKQQGAGWDFNPCSPSSVLLATSSCALKLDILQKHQVTRTKVTKSRGIQKSRQYRMVIITHHGYHSLVFTAHPPFLSFHKQALNAHLCQPLGL